MGSLVPVWRRMHVHNRNKPILVTPYPALAFPFFKFVYVKTKQPKCVFRWIEMCLKSVGVAFRGLPILEIFTLMRVSWSYPRPILPRQNFPSFFFFFARIWFEIIHPWGMHRKAVHIPSVHQAQSDFEVWKEWVVAGVRFESCLVASNLTPAGSRQISCRVCFQLQFWKPQCFHQSAFVNTLEESSRCGPDNRSKWAWNWLD